MNSSAMKYGIPIAALAGLLVMQLVRRSRPGADTHPVGAALIPILLIILSGFVWAAVHGGRPPLWLIAVDVFLVVYAIALLARKRRLPN